MATQQVHSLAASPAKRRPTTFIPLEDMLDSLGVDTDKALLEDRFIRVAVGQLSELNPYIVQYAAFLMDVHPSRSARYLAGALAGHWQQGPSSALLVRYGPSKDTVYPLVLGLEDHGRVYSIKEIFRSFSRTHEPSRDTIAPLVRYLDDPIRAPPIKEILHDYGPSAIMVGCLINALTDPTKKRAAADILKSFGRGALPFIHPPSPSSGVYTQLRNVIRQIERGA
ncbi:MAG TPA: hypothetical protein VI934_00505 [Candidatus Nanoarchaeia archaeon]|nr:hypothetical protein [Candidatus Nanoarchaeia archaeon]